MAIDVKPADTIHSYRGATVHKSRVAYLQELCRARRVVHVGCVDHGFYSQHLAAGRFLQDDLLAVASRVVGVDVDVAGISQMRADGYTDVHVLNIAEEAGRRVLQDLFGSSAPPEVVVCGEVIEHVDNPIQFVSGLIQFSQVTGAQFVITTPNPFYWGRFTQALRSREVVHPDHNAYLSLANLEAIVRKAGGATQLEFSFYENHGSTGMKSLVKRSISRAFPCLADGVIARFVAKA